MRACAVFTLSATLLVFGAAIGAAQTPAHHWSKSIGSPLWDTVYDVGADASGNVYVAGTFQDTIDVDGATLPTNGDSDSFLVKYNSAGVYQWALSFGSGSDFDDVRSLSIDPSGNVVITGRFFGNVDLGGGNIVGNGFNDIYIAKFNSDGVHQWSHGFGGASNDLAYGIDTDAFGDVYVTGDFSGTMDMGGGPLAGGVYLAKFDASGIHQWSYGFDGSSFENGRDVAVNANGDLYLVGEFFDSLSVGGPAMVSNGGRDVFIAKFDTSGSYEWSNGYGGVENDYASAVGITASGDAYFLGIFRQTVDFGGGGMSAVNSGDVFLVKYQGSNAQWLWGDSFGGLGSEDAFALAVDENDNVVIGGNFADVIEFGTGSPTHVAVGSLDGFIAAFSPDGTYLWSERHGDVLQDRVRALGTDGKDIIAAGELFGAIDIGGGPLPNAGAPDIFIGRFVFPVVDPTILSVNDVGNDQGREVQIDLVHSTYDATGSPTPILSYEVYRQDATTSSAAPRRASGNAIAAEGWTFVGSTPAHGATTYSVLAPTVGDSTVSQGNYASTFFVRATTAAPTTYFDSGAVSGYSLDNLAPPPPTSFLFASGNLSWDASTTADLDYFTVYGGYIDDFGGAVVVDHTIGETLNVSGSPYSYFYVTATDEAGNESDFAALDVATSAGNGLPHYILSISNYPNPFNPATTVRYTIPEPGAVTIGIFDVRGARVATLINNPTHSGGAFTVAWRGVDDDGHAVSSGVYFARIQHAGNVHTRKLSLLK